MYRRTDLTRARLVGLALVYCAVLGIRAIAAGPDGPAPLAPAPDSALVFKSGQAFLQRTVDVGSELTRVALPVSVHGTVWLEPTGIQLERIVTRSEPRTVESEVTNLQDMLTRAIGEQVILEIGDEESLECKIVRMLDSGQIPLGTRPPFTVRSTHVVVELNSMTRVLPIDAVKSVTLPSSSVDDWKFAKPIKGEVLEVRSTSSGRDPSFELFNMAGGLAWAPSYVLELGDGGRSRLRGKAVLINDMEDLVDTRVRLVVGYPSIEFARVTSALSPSVSLDALSRALSGQGVVRESAVMSQRMAAAPSFAAEQPSMTTLPGDSSEDLYIYDAGLIDLAMGERAYIPLSDETIRSEHRFDWILPDQVQNERFQDGQDLRIPVWHTLKLHNEASAPWTTAPILVMTDQGPLAQSTLDYTPAGSESTVRLTQALDVVGKSREARTDAVEAERKTVKLFGRIYETVEVEGVLDLTNRSRRTVPMHVVKSISGDVISTAGDPEIEARAAGMGEVNAARTLTWQFDLEPGKSWTSEYRYRVLIRR